MNRIHTHILITAVHMALCLAIAQAVWPGGHSHNPSIATYSMKQKNGSYKTFGLALGRVGVGTRKGHTHSGCSSTMQPAFPGSYIDCSECS